MMRALAIVAAVLISGCTTYTEAGLAGGVQGLFGGVNDRQVADRVWEIEADGNAFVGTGRMNDFVYLRAAEIGRREGYSHFQVLDAASGYRSQTIQNNSGRFNATTNCFGAHCNTRGTYSGPSSYEVHKPSAGLRVLFITEDEYASLPLSDRAMVTSVDRLWQDLGPQYISDFDETE